MSFTCCVCVLDVGGGCRVAMAAMAWLCEDGSPMPVAEHRFVALEPGEHEALEAMGELIWMDDDMKMI